MQKPLISVLLPIYNAEEFLQRTLDSLFYQTFTSFEIIAINDGSTDTSSDILKLYAERDSRITVIDQENKGLVATLNIAASHAKGKYIARMDSDDISLPRRFELQIQAFKDNPNAVLVGGGFDVMDEDEDILYHDAVTTEKEELFRALYTRNPLAHGSVMFLKTAFDSCGGYSDECGPTEDYELWTRLTEYGDIVAVAPTIFRWRINPNGITRTKEKIMSEYMKKNTHKFTIDHPVNPVSLSYLKRRGRYYVTTYAQHGVGMKHTMLRDCTSLGMSFVRTRNYSKALQQFIAVALTGRTGLRIVIERFKNTSRYYLKQYANKDARNTTTIDSV
jgi:glycosyltransferase involved in cell wall biosynthesis